MIILLSPAKTFDLTTPIKNTDYSQPYFSEEAEHLIKYCRELSAADIQELMKVSDNIAQLNFVRFNDWALPFNLDNARQAIYAFNGDVYTGLQGYDLSEKETKFAQKHLAILSGLYGILRPLDLIQPYRLEMGIPLKNGNNKNLYQFWFDKIAPRLNRLLDEEGGKTRVILNLASNEYFKSVDKKSLSAELIEPVFLDEGKTDFKVISFYAKKARGLMARFVIQNQITDPNELLKFSVAGYQFDEELSTPNQPVFKRYKNEISE